MPIEWDIVSTAAMEALWPTVFPFWPGGTTSTGKRL